jgi:ribosomal protein L16/L10AE
MKADRVEVSRDEQRDTWLIRIQIGEEVIRRHCNEAANADREALRGAAVKIAGEEGYAVDPSSVVFS